MGKAGKALSNKELTTTELGLIIDTAICMDRYIHHYDFKSEVEALLRNLKKEHFGVQLFLVANILNFKSAKWYKPEEIKSRFESHTGLGNSSSRAINKALSKLQDKTDFKNVTGLKEIKRVTGQKMHFNGFPSVWKLPTVTDVVRSIMNKPKIFNTIYHTLLQSGLLYDYWRHNFVTFLGFLKEIDENDVQKCELVLKNLLARSTRTNEE